MFALRTDDLRASQRPNGAAKISIFHFPFSICHCGHCSRRVSGDDKWKTINGKWKIKPSQNFRSAAYLSIANMRALGLRLRQSLPLPRVKRLVDGVQVRARAG